MTLQPYCLEREQWLPKPIEEVFAFFSRPENLQTITPPWLDFRMVKAPQALGKGAHIRYRLRWRWIPIRWTTEISEWNPPHRFVDRELSGPYTLWNHEHDFIASKSGTLMRDRVTYALPFGLVGRLAHRIVVEGDVKRIFDFRAKTMRGLFPAWGRLYKPCGFVYKLSKWRATRVLILISYSKPKTLNEAVSVLASPGGQILAGGTDFYPALEERLPQGDVVDITSLDEIRGISAQEGHFRIGGLTTWRRGVQSPHTGWTWLSINPRSERRALRVNCCGGVCGVQVCLAADGLDDPVNTYNCVGVEDGAVEISAKKKSDIADD